MIKTSSCNKSLLF